SAIFNVAVPNENVVTATATNTTADPSSPAGSVRLFNTSEFSVGIPTVLSDFTVGIPHASAMIVAGQSANFTVTIASQGGFTGAANLSCSGLPNGASCAFVPPSLTIGGSPVSSALTIATAPHLMTSAFTIRGTLASALRGLTGLGLLGLVIIRGVRR